MDNNFNNDNVQPNQTPVTEQNNYDAQYAASNQKPDYSAQYAQYNQSSTEYGNQPQQAPAQPQYEQYQPQQTPAQPQYEQYQPQQYEYNQQQATPVQPYDYNQAGYQQPQPIQYQSYEAHVPEEQPIGAAKGLGIASLICGIISILVSCCCGGLIVGIPGLIMGIISKVQCQRNNPMATVGLILSIIGIVLTIILLIVSAVLGGGLENILDSYYYYY